MAIKRIQPVTARDPSYSEVFQAGRPAPPAPTGPTADAATPTEAPAPSKASARPATEAAAPNAAPPRSSSPTPPAPPPVREPSPEPARAQEVGAGKRGRRAVGVRLRALERQARRIRAAGLPMDQVLRAAWRATFVRAAITPTYVEPVEAERSEDQASVLRSTLTVEAAILDELARAHDPFGVRGPWALIRGQVEGAFWQSVDDVLDRFAPATQADSDPAGEAGAGEA